jgi:hypothetical protein
LKRFSTKSPLLDGVFEQIVERSQASEARFEGIEAKGLLAAFLLDTLAISLASDAAWSTHMLNVHIYELDAFSAVQGTDERIQHASTPEHVSQHAPVFEEQSRNLVQSGKDLVQHRELLLPWIRFCSRAEEELLWMGRNDSRVPWVKRCVFDLNDCCRNWSQGEFQHESLRGKASPEGEAVHNDPDLRRQRTFVCPDGQERYFDWHLKKSGWRLYYLPKADEHLVLIGYIGLHLDTQRY